MGSFILIAIGVAVGWTANSIMFKYNISDHPEKMIDMLNKLNQIKSINKKLQNPTVNVVIENHGTLWYAFLEDSHTFLGQGPSVEEVIEKITEKYPEYNFTIESEDTE